MYLHLGRDIVVPYKSIIGIFDLDNTTNSKITTRFLSEAEKNGNVFNVSDELPKSFVVCADNGYTSVYISQISTATLLKRAEQFSI